MGTKGFLGLYKIVKINAHIINHYNQTECGSSTTEKNYLRRENERWRKCFRTATIVPAPGVPTRVEHSIGLYNICQDRRDRNSPIFQTVEMNRPDGDGGQTGKDGNPSERVIAECSFLIPPPPNTWLPWSRFVQKKPMGHLEWVREPRESSDHGRRERKPNRTSVLPHTWGAWHANKFRKHNPDISIKRWSHGRARRGGRESRKSGSGGRAPPP